MYYNVTIKVMGPLKYQRPDLFVISQFFWDLPRKPRKIDHCEDIKILEYPAKITKKLSNDAMQIFKVERNVDYFTCGIIMNAKKTLDV